MPHGAPCLRSNHVWHWRQDRMCQSKQGSSAKLRASPQHTTINGVRHPNKHHTFPRTSVRQPPLRLRKLRQAPRGQLPRPESDRSSHNSFEPTPTSGLTSPNLDAHPRSHLTRPKVHRSRSTPPQRWPNPPPPRPNQSLIEATTPSAEPAPNSVEPAPKCVEPTPLGRPASRKSLYDDLAVLRRRPLGSGFERTAELRAVAELFCNCRSQL